MVSGRGAAAIILCATALAARGQTAAQLRREIAAVGVTERLGARTPGVRLVAEDGAVIALPHDRPVLLSFNYTSCPRLCSLQLGGLARALHELRWNGEGFSVLTVSIDPKEKLPQLRAYRAQMLREAGGGGQSWRFAVAAQEEVRSLADAVGFRYRYDPATGDFDHQATLIVLTPDGRVSSYLHGITYGPGAIRDAVARAARGEIASRDEQASIGGFVLACMGFDPKDPAPRALKIMRAGGVGIALFLFGFIGLQALRSRKVRRV